MKLNSEEMKENNEVIKEKIFCFDFDQTLVFAHYHHLLLDAKRQATKEGVVFDSIAETNALLDNPRYGLKNSDQTKLLIQLALHNGHHVAITSFTKFPECFEPTLVRLGLEEEERNRIARFSGLPKKKDSAKSEHIDKAMHHFGISDKTQVYLIDDDQRNCEAAINAGFNVVIVPLDIHTNPSYLDDALVEASKSVNYDKTKEVKVSIEENVSNSLSLRDKSPIRKKGELSFLEAHLLRKKNSIARSKDT